MRYYFLFFLGLFCMLSFSQESPFFAIARKGSIVDAQTYLQTHPNSINEVNQYKFSPLILACYNGNEDMVNFLLDNNAEINYISPEGTVLMAATVKGNDKLVEKLLKLKADPNLTNEKGITALMYAVQFKNAKIVNLLLRYGANKLIIDAEGKTAFEYAVLSKNDEIINLLK